MTTATLTSKGQLTLPKIMREELKLKAGDKIDFVKDGSGHYMLRPANHDARSLFGCLADLYDGKPVSVADMDRGIAAVMRARHPTAPGARSTATANANSSKGASTRASATHSTKSLAKRTKRK